MGCTNINVKKRGDQSSRSKEPWVLGWWGYHSTSQPHVLTHSRVAVVWGGLESGRVRQGSWSSSVQRNRCPEPVRPGIVYYCWGVHSELTVLQKQKSGCFEMKEGLPRAFPLPFLLILKNSSSFAIRAQIEWETGCWGVLDGGIGSEGENKNKYFLLFQLNFITMSSNSKNNVLYNLCNWQSTLTC